jgi:phosphoribosylformylglycinamidine cyclo-ligase
MATYKQAGVDVKLGDICSHIMSESADKTFSNRNNKLGKVKVIEQKGLHRVITISLGVFKIMLNSDGIGTKVEFAERMGRHDTMAYDLFAMLCDDSVRYGAEPVAISNILDMNSLNKKIVQELANGMEKAAKVAGVAVISGEIAELGRRVSGYGDTNYNWGGTVLSVIRKELDSRKIVEGDSVVSFKEYGFRSNGISLVRNVMEKKYGQKWHTKKVDEKQLGDMALEPSVIYSKAVLDVLDSIKGVAHITGGGIPGKLGRVISKTGLGAEISDPFEPCQLMSLVQKEGNITDKEAYLTWNMGQGMMVITDNPEKVMKTLKKYKIETKISGQITDQDKIKIYSRGVFNNGKTLEFSIK